LHLYIPESGAACHCYAALAGGEDRTTIQLGLLFRFLFLLRETRNNAKQTELGIRYFLPFSLFANPLLQCSYSLSLLRYFSEIGKIFAIPVRYSLFATSFEECNRLYISELFKLYAGLWIRIYFNLDPVHALDFWGF
jgi:hypothetical protein